MGPCGYPRTAVMPGQRPLKLLIGQIPKLIVRVRFPSPARSTKAQAREGFPAWALIAPERLMIFRAIGA